MRALGFIGSPAPGEYQGENLSASAIEAKNRHIEYPDGVFLCELRIDEDD